MLTWFRHLDQLLRGERTRTEALTDGQIDLPLRRFVPLAVVLGVSYGFFMGWYALALHWGTGKEDGWMQLIAGMIKLPMLFLFTLGVTFPSLYVFNALVGARLSFHATLRLLVAAIVINLAVAASLGTILGFFTLSTTSYAFMIVLNVALLGIAGAVGLGFLLQTLRRLSAARRLPEELGERAQPEVSSTGVIFGIWIFIYALVGMQMGWLLRPFIGRPGMAFEWFRPREGNFFAAFFQSLQRLLGA